MIDLSEYEYIVVGAGLTGSTVARILADNNKKVLVVEKRNTVGGNLFDYVSDCGLIVQKYGPHTFHTNNKHIVEFIKRFADFKEHHTKCEVFIDGVFTPSPFNFKTIDQFYPEFKAKVLKQKLLNKYRSEKATILELLNDKDEDIYNFASFLFAKDYSLYTSKQWGISPDKVSPEVLKRVPVYFSYKDWYFYDDFEAIPIGGFTKFIKRMLDHENINVVLNEDAFQYISFEKNCVLFDGAIKKIVFTGELDRLFSNVYGRLPYRSLRFEFEELNSNYQDVSIVAYPSHDYLFTRITEYNKMPFQDNKKTVIAKEYPQEYTEKTEPYYPILTEDSSNLYSLYEKLACKYDNLYVVGRLAEFKYYNMDQAIDSAIKLSNRILREETND